MHRQHILTLFAALAGMMLLSCGQSLKPASAPDPTLIPTLDSNSIGTFVAGTANAASTQTQIAAMAGFTPVFTPTPFATIYMSNTPAPTDTNMPATLTTTVASGDLVAFDDIYAAGIEWMDHLKTCTPYKQSYIHPFLNVEQINTIVGRDGNVCVMVMQNVNFTIDCRLDEVGIQAFTRDELYEQARSRTLSFDSSDPTTEITNAQCKTALK